MKKDLGCNNQKMPFNSLVDDTIDACKNKKKNLKKRLFRDRAVFFRNPPLTALAVHSKALCHHRKEAVLSVY